MKRNVSSPNSDSTSRCIHSTSHGKRCRMLTTPDSRYCHSHATHAKLDATTLAAELSLAAASLATPEDVHRALGKIFLALCDDRISLKKAGTLSYIAQMLLRSHREMAIHRKMEMEWKEIEGQHAPLQPGETIRGWFIPSADRSDPAPPPTESAAPSPQSDSGTPGETPTVSETAKPNSTNSASPELTAESSEPPKIPARKSPPPENPPHTTISAATQAPPRPDLNHLFPIDFTLPPGLQDHRKNIPPPGRRRTTRSRTIPPPRAKRTIPVMLSCVAAAVCGGRLFQTVARMNAIQYVFPCTNSGTIKCPGERSLPTSEQARALLHKFAARTRAEVPCTRYNR
jgi:hypothetical protein